MTDIKKLIFWDGAEYDYLYDVMPPQQLTPHVQKTINHSKGQFMPLVYVSANGEDWYDNNRDTPGDIHVSAFVDVDKIMLFPYQAVYVRVMGLDTP